MSAERKVQSYKTISRGDSHFTRFLTRYSFVLGPSGRLVPTGDALTLHSALCILHFSSFSLDKSFHIRYNNKQLR